VEVKIGIVKIKNQLNVIMLLVNVGLNRMMLPSLKNVKLLVPFVPKFGLNINEYKINNFFLNIKF